VNIGSGAQPVGLTAANGRVWVSDGPTGDVTAIDAASKHVVATVHVGGQLGSVLATGDAVWVSVFGGGTVARIDAVHDVVTAQVAVGGRPTGLAIDPSGALWVGNLDGYVSRIDTATGKVTGKVTLPSGASQPLATRGLIWVGLQSGSVVTVDPATSAITGSSISVAQDVDALADTSNGLWVSTFSGTAALLDPTARTVTHRVKLGSSGSGLSFGNGSVWVSGYDSGLVLQLDPATGALLGAVHTGTQPRDSVVVGSVLWVADQGDGAVTPIPI
jgi:YVTN family beta-propeller protein